MWVKFDEVMDVECVCEEDLQECSDGNCEEYVVKFTKIERTMVDDVIDSVSNLSRHISKESNKLNSELKKSINKFKI